MKPELQAILPNLQGVRLYVKETDDPKPEVCATPRRELNAALPSMTLFFRFPGSIMWVNLKQDANPFNKVYSIQNGKHVSFNDYMREIISPPAVRGGRVDFRHNNVAFSAGQRWMVEKHEKNAPVFFIDPVLVDSVYSLGARRKTAQFSQKLPANAFSSEKINPHGDDGVVVTLRAFVVAMPPGTVFDPMNAHPSKYPYIENCPLPMLTYSHRLGKYVSSKGNNGWVPVTIPQMKIVQQGFDPSLFREFFKKEVTF